MSNGIGLLAEMVIMLAVPALLLGTPVVLILVGYIIFQRFRTLEARILKLEAGQNAIPDKTD